MKSGLCFPRSTPRNNRRRPRRRRRWTWVHFAPVRPTPLAWCQYPGTFKQNTISRPQFGRVFVHLKRDVDISDRKFWQLQLGPPGCLLVWGWFCWQMIHRQKTHRLGSNWAGNRAVIDLSAIGWWHPTNGWHMWTSTDPMKHDGHDMGLLLLYTSKWFQTHNKNPVRTTKHQQNGNQHVTTPQPKQKSLDAISGPQKANDGHRFTESPERLPRR